ncbi:3-oxoacyl-[acyl-carrier-protein] synthase, KASII [Enhygromyxa salina]|uniref:3-oxoacyl-[acyl-carrier-protein] synthase 2 n=1 Tax=Enhygromyxa salina TaxID=215803 RepID=A0A0C2D9E1_9BACT|nr:beta-ketoacyl-ACP synthase II [Enhygromyxa salina]KIG18195.1 3-oxoacyl-[acyl-carrier-protein] synthase, KASII [Enhygromyxa salina]
MAERKVAVTGTAMITPLGLDTEQTWEAVIAGRSGVGPITKFDASDLPTRIAAEVRDFEPTKYFSKKYTRQMDTFIQYAVAASYMALEDAGLHEDRPPAERTGVYVGSGLGGITTIEATHLAMREKGWRHGISPYFVPALIINLAGGQISIFQGFKGPLMSHVSACSTAAHSIGEAYLAIRYGRADVMIAGGTESTITALSVGGFAAARALSKNNEEPTKASRPFTKSRDGFVMGEGCGLLVLEDMDRAKARGAKIIAEIVGYGANSDAHHVTAPSPNGEGAQACIRLTLEDAGISGDAIGYVNAHGTSTGADTVESQAIRQVFGAHADKLQVSSTKSMHAHLLGAAGSVEGALCCLALSRGVLPPTINLDDPDPSCDLDYIPHQARRVEVEYALSNSFGFGGTNACLLFKRTP